MKFDVQLESIATNNINMDFFYVPWDSHTFNRNVAQISKFEIHNTKNALADFQLFLTWCLENKITFISCRLLHSQVNEAIFLESNRFKFIELNYRPIINNIESLKLPISDIAVNEAEKADMPILANIAEKVFHHERFHTDPLIETDLANKRYRFWLENAFEQKQQKILKFTLHNELIAFFVVEYPESNHCLWSLTGMLPKFQGKGLGKQVWKTMLKHHQNEAINTVSTSISSHNIPVFNLYVALGFRFPEPYTTFHCSYNHA
ncbi:MAG: dTDP-4-amino-4,6-dideoxy-D-galactose acyltransferase [Methyloprofundus sp.]|nr:MAG: dTDP-4-amino-4,6-dideoxy-D-galactose acyltransferase [Methyloprofundus sp.]